MDTGTNRHRFQILLKVALYVKGAILILRRWHLARGFSVASCGIRLPAKYVVLNSRRNSKSKPWLAFRFELLDLRTSKVHFEVRTAGHGEPFSIGKAARSSSPSKAEMSPLTSLCHNQFLPRYNLGTAQRRNELARCSFAKRSRFDLFDALCPAPVLGWNHSDQKQTSLTLLLLDWQRGKSWHSTRMWWFSTFSSLVVSNLPLADCC